MTDDEKKSAIVPSRVERSLDVAAFIGSAVPWIGGPVSNVLSGLSVGRKFTRVEELIIGLADDLAELKSDVSKEYVATEEFEELLEQTLRRVGDERLDQKRQIYRAFLAGDIELPTKFRNYDKKIEILRAVEMLQSDDLEVVRALRATPEPDPGSMGSPIQTIRRRIRGMDDRRIDDAVDRLNNMRIISLGSLRTMMTGHGAADLRPSFTPLGLNLLQFINDGSEFGAGTSA